MMGDLISLSAAPGQRPRAGSSYAALLGSKAHPARYVHTAYVLSVCLLSVCLWDRVDTRRMLTVWHVAGSVRVDPLS